MRQLNIAPGGMASSLPGAGVSSDWCRPSADSQPVLLALEVPYDTVAKLALAVRVFHRCWPRGFIFCLYVVRIQTIGFPHSPFRFIKKYGKGSCISISLTNDQLKEGGAKQPQVYVRASFS